MRAPRGRYAGAASAEPEPSGTACAAGVAVLARLGGAPPTRTGGADSPIPPNLGGLGAPEYLRRNRRRGGAMQARPAGALDLGLHCGGVALRNGWRLASTAGAQT